MVSLLVLEMKSVNELNSIMIKAEKNTLFSSLLSQKKVWETQQIIDLAESILAPFKNLDLSELERSKDVSMLMDIINILPYKLSCYKYIVNDLYKDGGMACDNLVLNVFNSDCGLDSISFLSNLISKGYKTENIKQVRLFCENEEALKRSILIHNYLFPSINVTPYLLSIKQIKSECICNSLLTINIFPHTFNQSNNTATEIGELLIRSHQIYSHSIFFEFVDSDKVQSIPSLDCSYYWLDLEKTKFVKNRPSRCSYTPRGASLKNLKLSCSSKFSIFSNTSIADLELNHEYKIILSGLCPGTPSRALFNATRIMLFFDTPFKNLNDESSNIDNETVVTSEKLFLTDEIKTYTLLDAIKQFPQYLIAESLDKDEDWAYLLYNFYLDAANKGNHQCYNNLAVLLSLRNCTQEDSDNLESEHNKQIINLLLQAINGGDIDAMINLASLYMYMGRDDEAYKYYELAYQNGSSCGAYSVGVATQFGLCGIKPNPSKAIQCYRSFFDLLNAEKENDSFNYAPESINCLNLIMLMYDEGYSLCEITKEYNKVKKPSDELKYAYTVISNNLSNRASDIFKILKLKEDAKEGEPSYVTYNRLCALHKGVVNGKNELSANPKLALEKLKLLADTGCPDWPEWQQFVWSTLAQWTYEAKEDSSSVLASTYWLKAFKAGPSNECAYRTNIALFGNISDEEKKSIWKKFAFGNSCQHCHECSNYDQNARCCPKAQLHWARDFETDENLSAYLLKLAVNQNYLPAINEFAINRILKKINISLSPRDNAYLNYGIVPEVLLGCLDNFSDEEIYNLLCLSAQHGSRRAAGLLTKIAEKYRSDFEYFYWTFLSLSVVDKFSLLSKLSNKSLSDGYFDAKTLLEKDFLKLATQISEQFIGTKEFAFETLSNLAEFYFKGECYRHALKLYKIAEEKGFDVSEKISDLKDIIEEEENERWNSRYYDYHDDYHDYGRDTWDALTDGMYGDYPGSGVDYDFLGFD